ncbi:hypothetical protein OGR47_03420 [Methylocystis sp. MJC1]|jgi:hypothetical protein|uniref:hypothetical protein n=1 Tax=Methylocystis sp. MJC1 TaxID=2654282 RepID=UPI0013EC37F5|nr:hypothetical protein [Methylocystis sp. MJC1]KAF2991016.1 hypothetical protein MJC1_01748 [Methylocystis sp. MJC1]MBU6526064.1 hypothetical protein [Methylocystis sp. MJC1]UZX12526.1 hypothetical protein OGR47_03420 [Methylocystis sp. MJC1]
MRKGLNFSVGLACLIAIAAGGDALAKSHRRPAYSVSHSQLAANGRAPVEVERRSWLDPGTKVPVGSTNRYMLQQTYLNHDPIEANQRSWYMQETAPQRPPYNTDMIVPYDEGLPFDWP